MPVARRRAAGAAAVAAAVLTAYVAGVATGGFLSGGSTRRAEPGSGVLDEAARRIAASAAKPVSLRALDAAAVRGMLGALGDRWSAYYGADDFARFQASLDGEYTGVGLWLRRDARGRLVVTSVQPGSPAAGAGVGVGEQVVAVAGRPVTGRSVADVVADLRGGAGSRVAVVVAGPAGERRLTLRRTALDDDDVSVDTIAPDVARIRVAAFTRGVGRRVRQAAAALRARHVAAIVLDLRDDPGGLVDEAVETASVFLDGGPVVTYARRGGRPDELDARGHGDTSTPLAVLVDSGTASAAEIVTAALQDRDRAVVVGSRTFGKGSVQEPTQLPDGSAVELTVGHYVTPAGRSLDGVGIDPDIEVAPNAPLSAAEKRAVEVLGGLLADAGDRG